MIAYKVSIEIKKEIEKDWFNWMSTNHIPNVINTGVFLDFSFNKMLRNGSVPTEGYEKYEIVYYCRNVEDYDKYQKNFAQKLQQEHTEKFKDKFISSRETYEDVTSLMKLAHLS
ncbi:MAG TPA: DUF4286 family protein [Bacteroidia bacterium]|nr:DUF4286 family protein [Bacteroidia bacterium]HRH09604.1 DUF4286 family protein [Bacteroidia bacterium]